MKKQDLNAAVTAAKEETKNALQTVYDALNQGQQKKIVKEPQLKALFDRYGVEYED
jgi:Fe2+ or Zn2+ uptake regulation protein